jgi:hypothetical protein
VNNRRFQILDWCFLAGILILLSMQFWLPPPRGGITDDSWGTSPQGKKAFYLLARAQSAQVSRSTQPLLARLKRMSEEWDYEATLCILGPSRAPTEPEWNAILTWIRGGGHLLYAVPGTAKQFEIPELGLRAIPLDGEESAEFSRRESSGPRGGDLSALVGTDEDDWPRGSRMELSGAAATPLLIHEGTMQAAQQSWGRGRVTVVADDAIFTNRSLVREENAVLAWRLLEAAESSTGEIIFEEYLHRSGTPKVLALLLDEPFRSTTLQALLLACLFAWYASHRFGPYLAESTEPRRNIVDHTDNVGNLYFQRRNGAHPLRVYMKQLIEELRLKQFKGRERQILEPLALRMGCPVEELFALFKEAAQAVRSNFVDKKTAARLIVNLSQVRQAARVSRATRSRSR